MPKANALVGKWLLAQIGDLVRLFLEAKQSVVHAQELAGVLYNYLVLAAKEALTIEQATLLVRLIDDALRLMTTPLDSSAEELSITASDATRLVFDTESRFIVTSPLLDADDIPISEPTLQAVRFVRLNNKTGRGLINFKHDPEHQRHCIVQDSRFRRPGNEYDLAFAHRVWLEVLAAEMKPSEAGKQVYWVIVDTDGRQVSE